jgi:hypothetical protein
MSNQLITHFDKAKSELAKAKSIIEVMKVIDLSKMAKAVAQVSKDTSLEAEAIATRKMAERRLGQMIAEQKATVGLSKGGGPGSGRGNKGVKARVRKKPALNEPVTLAEAGIDKNLAHRARQMAALPESTFNQAINKLKEKVTTGARKAEKEFDRVVNPKGTNVKDINPFIHEQIKFYRKLIEGKQMEKLQALVSVRKEAPSTIATLAETLREYIEVLEEIATSLEEMKHVD